MYFSTKINHLKCLLFIDIWKLNKGKVFNLDNIIKYYENSPPHTQKFFLEKTKSLSALEAFSEQSVLRNNAYSTSMKGRQNDHTVLWVVTGPTPFISLPTLLSHYQCQTISSPLPALYVHGGAFVWKFLTLPGGTQFRKVTPSSTAWPSDNLVKWFAFRGTLFIMFSDLPVIICTCRWCSYLDRKLLADLSFLSGFVVMPFTW